MPKLKVRIEELEQRTLRDGFWTSGGEAQKVLKEKTHLESLVAAVDSLRRDVTDARELLELARAEKDDAVALDVGAQLHGLTARVSAMELDQLLAEPEDKLDAILEINAGAGGVDAQDWAQMLLRMYLRWAERRGFATELLDEQPGEEAGIKSASVLVRGVNAYGYLHPENGVHRLIRISPFDSQARRQTAFASVHVTPDIDEDFDVEIKDTDYDFEAFRSGGKGGQNVNKVSSAVRLTHKSTGIVVKVQSERSQHENRRIALRMLKSKLFELEKEQREAAFAQKYEANKSQIAFGSQIRSYTLAPYRMVKDERTDEKLSNVEAVLDGELDPFIQSYLLHKMNRRKAAQTKDSSI